MNKAASIKLNELRERANACGATPNVRDAERDLMDWPRFWRSILRDLEDCIVAWEERKAKTNER